MPRMADKTEITAPHAAIPTPNPVACREKAFRHKNIAADTAETAIGNINKWFLLRTMRFSYSLFSENCPAMATAAAVNIKYSIILS